MKHLRKLNINEKAILPHAEGYGYYSLCNVCMELSEIARRIKEMGITCDYNDYACFIDVQVANDAEALLVSKFLTGDEVEGDKSDDVETDDAGVIRHKMVL